MAWQLVIQPVAGAGNDLHVLGFQADFFLQFPVHGLLQTFALADSTLGELPGVLPDTLGPHHLAARVADNDANIGTETFRVNHTCLVFWGYVPGKSPGLGAAQGGSCQYAHCFTKSSANKATALQRQSRRFLPSQSRRAAERRQHPTPRPGIMPRSH